MKTLHGSTLSTFALHALHSPLCKELLQTVEPLILQHVNAMTRVDLSYILSAYTKSRQGSTFFYTTIIRQLITIKSTLNAIDIASITQALSKIGRGGDHYLLQLEDCVLSATNIRTHDLCLILNAYSKTHSSKIFDHFEKDLIKRKHLLDSRQIATILNAYCRRKPKSVLFPVLVERVVKMEMDNWAVANVIHAYVTAFPQPKHILTALQSKLSLETMKTKELMQVYWGYCSVPGFQNVLNPVKSILLRKIEEIDADAVSLIITCQVKSGESDLIDPVFDLIRRKNDIKQAFLGNNHLLIRTLHALAKGNLDKIACELYSFAPKNMLKELNCEDFAVLLTSLCKINISKSEILPYISIFPSMLPKLSPKQTINLFFQLSRIHYSSLIDLKLYSSHFFAAAERANHQDQSISTQIKLVTKHLDVS